MSTKDLEDKKVDKKVIIQEEKNGDEKLEKKEEIDKKLEDDKK